MRIPAEYEAFWAAGELAHRELDRHRFLEAFAFGDSERTATALSGLVLRGVKRATASLVWTYEHERRPWPKVGDLSIVTTWAKEPLCIIKTTQVDVVPFEEVSEEFAKIEGEGDGTLASWRRNHLEFFAGQYARMGCTPHSGMLVVCEQFRVVFQPAGTRSAA
jgi:uncharacterized protein YhfF